MNTVNKYSASESEVKVNATSKSITSNMNTRSKSTTAASASSSTRQRSPSRGRATTRTAAATQRSASAGNLSGRGPTVSAPVNLIEDVDASGQAPRVRVVVQRDEDMATNEPTAKSTSDNEDVDMDETALAGQLFKQLMKAAKQTKNSPEKNSYRDAFDSVKDFTTSVNVNDWIKYFRLATEGLSQVAKLRLFRAKLAAECYSWYANKDADGEMRALDDWFDELREEYSLAPERLREAIVARKQKEGESAEAYIRDILTLCKRYHSWMPETEKIAFIRDNVYFKYKRHFNLLNVHASTVRMTEQSLRAAMDFEKERALRFNSVNLAQPADQPNEFQKRGQEKGATRINEEGEVFLAHQDRSQQFPGKAEWRGNQRANSYGSYGTAAHRGHRDGPVGYSSRPQREQTRNFPPRNAQSGRQQYQQRNERQNRSLSQRGRSSRAGLRCYQCQGIGHFASECPSEPAYAHEEEQNVNGLNPTANRGNFRGRNRARGRPQHQRMQSPSPHRESGNGDGRPGFQ